MDRFYYVCMLLITVLKKAFDTFHKICKWDIVREKTRFIDFYFIGLPVEGPFELFTLNDAQVDLAREKMNHNDVICINKLIKGAKYKPGELKLRLAQNGLY